MMGILIVKVYRMRKTYNLGDRGGGAEDIGE